MDQTAVWEDAAAYREKARCCLERIKTGTPSGKEEFYRGVREYALAKFLLPKEEEGEEIAALAAKSMAKILHIPAESLRQYDKPSGCTYATSVSDKKILLIMSLSKALGVSLPASAVPGIQTLEQLAEALWKGRQGG